MPSQANKPNSSKARVSKQGVKVGLIGRGIQKSRTPQMHVEAGAAHGIDYQYSLRDTEMLDSNTADIGLLLDTAEADGLTGLNITYPFKQSAIAYLDELSTAADTVGAVNTVVFKEGRRFGHNTDYWGFVESFRITMNDVRLSRVLQIGAGGAGSAVSNALMDYGVKHVSISDTNPDAAQELVEKLKSRNGKAAASVAFNPEEETAKADGLINTSPVGMKTLPGSPIQVELIQSRHWVADIIYFPLETEFLAAARKRGCRTMDGSGMAVFQAVRAFELFTGLRPDPKRMRATFDAFTQ